MKNKKIFIFIFLIFYNAGIIRAQQIKLLDSTSFLQERKAILKHLEEQHNEIKSYHTEEDEDATSTWYYVFYYNTKNLLKIRTVWNGGCCQSPMVYDLYYTDSSLVLMDEFIDIQKTVSREKAVDNLIKGKNLRLKLIESLMYKQNALIGYIKNSSSNIELKEREDWGLGWGELKNNFDRNKLKTAQHK